MSAAWSGSAPATSTNAIDHAHPDGERSTTALVLILVAGDDQAAAIAVRDYGVGLAPGESAMVFNRFWRADPARALDQRWHWAWAVHLDGGGHRGDTCRFGSLQAAGRPRGCSVQIRSTLPRRVGGSLRQSPLPLVPDDAPGAGPMKRRTAARASAWAAVAAAWSRDDLGGGVASADSGPAHETTLAGLDRDELPPNIYLPATNRNIPGEEIAARRSWTPGRPPRRSCILVAPDNLSNTG